MIKLYAASITTLERFPELLHGEQINQASSTLENWLSLQPNQRTQGRPCMFITLRASSEMKKLRRSRSQEMADGVIKPQKTCLQITTWTTLFLLVMSSSIINVVKALPFPAPSLYKCLTFEHCCTPVPASFKDPTEFQFQMHLPMRIRPAAHLVDDAYIAKYQRAMELMMALPDTDGRSFTNQWKLHCLYCDNHLYFDTQIHPYPLEIHKSWLFYPWHRLFLYFHERILAKLIDDDTFALPFWNWDNQSPEQPQANVVPRVYAQEMSLVPGSINKSSSLYDPTRSPCGKDPEGFLDFEVPFACTGAENASEIRALNAHVMFVNMVGVGVTPLLFHGMPYRLGDLGGGGFGALERVPHGFIHIWVNPFKMLLFKLSASDPIFFGHHANLDRLWEVWKTLPGGIRKEVSDPDFLDTKFTFYDENGDIVTASVAQSLQLDQLR